MALSLQPLATQFAEINFKLFPGFKLSGRNKTGMETKVTSKSHNSIVASHY